MKKYFTMLKGLLVDLYTDITGHWKKPGKGNFVSYKEMINYSVGGMGQQMLIMFIGYFGLNAANTLLGSTIGIRPMHLQNMAVVQQIITVFLCIIRGKLVDNTRTKWGRFRPYMFIASIPVLVLGVTFLFLDFKTMTYNTKLLYVFSFSIAIMAISPLLTDTYTELATVITPNTKERAKFYSVTSIIYSFAPTIYMFMIPILSGLTGGYTNINTYRYVIAPLAILGFFLNMFVVFGCKEKVVTSKTYVQKVSTFKACLQIYRNKYWWIRTIAGAIGFLEGAFNVLFLWIFMYQAQDMTTYAFLVTIQGSASLIAMVLTPFILKKLGNRKTLLFHNIVNVIFISFMLATFKLPGLFFVFLYVNTIVNQLQIVYSPVMHSEVKDYQQYISGKRLDFTFGAAGQIMLPFTILSGYCIPLVYESFGLTTNYDIMYDPVMRNKLFAIICALSVVGAALNLIPFFFYRMTRAKHKMIINVLRLRAGLEDYASGDISPYVVKDMIDGVNEYIDVMKKSNIDLKADKRAIKNAKAMSKGTVEEKSARAEAIKAAREQFTFDQYMIELREGAVEIFEPEMNKYNSKLVQTKVAVAKHISELKVEELINLNMSDINLEFVKEIENTTLSIASSKVKDDTQKVSDAINAKKAKKEAKEELKIQKYLAKTAKSIEKMKKLIAKYYPAGLVENKRERLDAALEMPYVTKEQHKERAAAIRAAEKEFNTYTKVITLYSECKSVYNQYYSKCNFHEIEALFEDSVKHIQEQEALALAEEERLKKERREELDRLLSLKKAKKADKKSKSGNTKDILSKDKSDVDIEDFDDDNLDTKINQEIASNIDIEQSSSENIIDNNKEETK